MIRAVVYVRVSTERQASEGESLEMQVARAREVCEAHGWELTEVYQDVISGRKDKRPALQRFERDLKAGKFGAVICYKVDRLGRSRRKMHELLELIQARDIRLVSLTQQIDTSTASGRMMLSILVDFAVFEVEQLSERVSDTLLHVAKSGRHPSGNVPYGYRYEPNRREVGEDGSEVRISGRLVVVPAEAEGVRLAFDHYQRVGSLASTAKALNQSGYRTRGGNPWDASAIRMLICNPLYGGERALRRWSTKGSKRPTGSAMLRTLPDWVMVPADHEPIVPTELAQAVRQTYWTLRGTPSRTRTSRSPWTGMVICEACGGKMGRYLPGDGSPAYRCRSRVVGACDGRSVPEPWLDIEVIRSVSRALDAAGAVQKEAAKPRQRAGVIAAPERSRDQKLAALKRKLERLETRFEEEVIGRETYVTELRKIRAEIEAVQASHPTSQVERFTMPRPLLETWQGLSGADDVSLRRRLVESLISRVVVGSEHARVHLYAQEGLSLPEAIEVPIWPPNTRAYLKRAWSATAPACIDCGTNESRHYAKGRCRPCYLRHQRNRG